MNWKCFHCDEVFTEEASAAEHFGRTPHQKPACTIDVAEYRRMEQLAKLASEEDLDAHRQIHALQADHAVALQRAEEQGYSRGINEPRDIVLHCPKCNTQHIDAPDPHPELRDLRKPVWVNPPHRSHLCGACGHQWRPCDLPTNGVAAVATKGQHDSPIAKGNPWRVGQFVVNTAQRSHGPMRVDELQVNYGFAYTLVEPHHMGRHGTLSGGIVYNTDHWETYHAVPPQR